MNGYEDLQKNLLEKSEIALGVHVATVSLRIRDLLDLIPGSHLALPLELPQRVILMLGDAPVAEARVVNLENGHALEIVSMFDEETSSELSR